MSLFLNNIDALATALVGRNLTLPNGQVVEITKVDSYHRSANDSGPYKPILVMEPGSVFTPKVMGHAMFLIAALDGGERGGCVRITGIKTAENEVITGGGRVGKYVGFDHQQTGRVEVIDDDGNLKLTVEGVLVPQMPKSTGAGVEKKGTPLTETIIAKYADELPLYYTEFCEPADTSFEDLLQEVRDDWGTEEELKDRLKGYL
ncbi:hypothetical protein HOI18_01900 [Candidatus Uhrbacteria bacterium]|jgi:hypothetical protein|nr:hypothetical protein [Candidatus Uhrbacteria bacterium]